jgi:hypothetical protein
MMVFIGLAYTLNKQGYCAPNIVEIRDRSLLDKLGIGKDEVLEIGIYLMWNIPSEKDLTASSKEWLEFVGQARKKMTLINKTRVA